MCNGWVNKQYNFKVHDWFSSPRIFVQKKDWSSPNTAFLYKHVEEDLTYVCVYVWWVCGLGVVGVWVGVGGYHKAIANQGKHFSLNDWQLLCRIPLWKYEENRQAFIPRDWSTSPCCLLTPLSYVVPSPMSITSTRRLLSFWLHPPFLSKLSSWCVWSLSASCRAGN